MSGVLFAILAFSSDPVPAYLRDSTVRWLGTGAVAAFFFSLLATLAVIYPRANVYKQDELVSMRQARRRMEQRKSWGLILGLACFLIGMGYLAMIIMRILWTL